MNTKNRIIAGVGLIAVALAQTAGAQVLVNGGFESTTAGNGQLGLNTDVTGWTVPTPPGNYAFVFAPGTADTSGANGEYGNVSIYGPGNGVNNGLTISPQGGNFVGMDGAFQSGAISQVVTGLTPGDSYSVSFYWAAAQQVGYTGASTEQFQVGFGGETLFTPIVSIASEGFSGWQSTTLTFTADNPSDFLSFLAVGTPSGIPPFALLDGVSVTAPDASSTLGLLGLASVGLMGFSARILRRRQSAQ